MVEEERKKKYIGRDFLKNLVKKKYSHSGKSSQWRSSIVKEFVEKNDTTVSESFLENSESVGNHNSNGEEDQSDRVVEISSLPPKNNPSLRKSNSPKSLPSEIDDLKFSPTLPFTGSILTLGGMRSLCEEERGKFNWSQASKFTQRAKNQYPSPARVPKAQAQSRTTFQARDPRAQARSVKNHATRVSSSATCGARGMTRFAWHATRVLPRMTRPVESLTRVFLTSAPFVGQPVVLWIQSTHILIGFGLEILIWDFLAHLKSNLGHSSVFTISTARRIISEGIQILIFTTNSSKGGKVLNQVEDFGKILTILNQVVVTKHILVGILTSIREGTIIHKHN
jgi:hypothetical protein